MSEMSLYERLGGIYSIAAVVEHFTEALAEDPVAGKNSPNLFLKGWYANRSWRAAGFIVLTTLWVNEKAGGPYKYVSTIPNNDKLDLEPTHYDMRLTEEEFTAAGQILANTLDHFIVPEKEKKKYSLPSPHTKMKSLVEPSDNKPIKQLIKKILLLKNQIHKKIKRRNGVKLTHTALSFFALYSLL